MARRARVIIASLLTIIVGAVFYYALIAPELQKQRIAVEAEKAEAKPVLRHPLNGVPVEIEPSFFPISVMYDNLLETTKRPGIEEARVVYEALAEGGITRLMAVFDSTQQVTSFGPVRSVRPYFIDWALEYGGILMHVGGSQEALQQLKKLSTDELIDIDQIGANESYYRRDESLRAPHNVFSTFSSWLSLGERLSIRPRTITPWKFAELPAEAPATATKQIDIQYAPGTMMSWAYDPQAKRYVRFMNGARQMGASGEQLGAATLIIIEVPSETIDAIGRQKMKTLGSGPVRVFAGGRVAEGTWIKETRASRMRFIGADQQELALAPGALWIEAVPTLEQVSVKSE